MLLHFGVGLLYQNYLEVAGAEGFHPSSIGLKGQNDDNVMPTIAGLSNAQGGYSTGIGPFTLINIVNPKPTANTSLTWVKGNHTYKFGGEWSWMATSTRTAPTPSRGSRLPHGNHATVSERSCGLTGSSRPGTRAASC